MMVFSSSVWMRDAAVPAQLKSSISDSLWGRVIVPSLCFGVVRWSSNMIMGKADTIYM